MSLWLIANILDDLPVWGMLGEAKNKKAYFYTHYMFTLTYNKDRVCNISIVCDT